MKSITLDTVDFKIKFRDNGTASILYKKSVFPDKTEDILDFDNHNDAWGVLRWEVEKALSLEVK